MGDLSCGSPAPQTEESASPILPPAILLALESLADDVLSRPLLMTLALRLSVLHSLSICGATGEVTLGVAGLLGIRSLTKS